MPHTESVYIPPGLTSCPRHISHILGLDLDATELSENIAEEQHQLFIRRRYIYDGDIREMLLIP